MKKLVFGLIATVLFAFNGNAQDLSYESRKVNNDKEMENILTFLKGMKISQEDYNLDDFKIISHKSDPTIELIVVNTAKFNSKNETNIALTISYVNEEFGNVIYVKTNSSEKSKIGFEYFDLNNSLIYSASLDVENGLTNTIFTNRGCGQAVADCIGDAYSHHGWVSVWAWVQSAFIPETVAAIALSCTAHNCR